MSPEFYNIIWYILVGVLLTDRKSVV